MTRPIYVCSDYPPNTGAWVTPRFIEIDNISTRGIAVFMANTAIDWKLNVLTCAEKEVHPRGIDECVVLLPIYQQAQMDALRQVIKKLDLQPRRVTSVLEGVEVKCSDFEEATLLKLAMPPIRWSLP